MPVRIREAIAVEGKYDAARLQTVVDTTIVSTGGFSLFRDREKRNLLQRLAETRGLIMLTDSDAAGFVIRDHISGALPKDRVKHAYVPPVAGKEKRKAAPSAEGLLGVEGIDGAVILEALLRAGATVEGEETVQPPPFLTKARLYADGLTGQASSAVKRQRLLQLMDLPVYLSANRMMEVLNAVISEGEYEELLKKL